MPSSFAVVLRNFQLHCALQKEAAILLDIFVKHQKNHFINDVVLDIALILAKIF